ncbi:hypothetical protein [Ekhidna sp.]|uniref:hypothetical protein n=1 Tax=Ekhidna sp. TaxID=2608089 RepID=UPI003298C9A3
MKSLLTLCCAILLIFEVNAQNIWIADNRPTAPSGSHIFADVASAITAASPGDIIHIIPSQTFYPDFTITKDSLTFFGIGFNPDKDQPNKTWVANVIIATGVFGTRISGLNVNDDLTIGNGDGSTGNIFIENGDIDRITTTTAGSPGKSLSNVVIRNCVIGFRETSLSQVINLTQETNPTSIVITNNVIMGSSTTSSGGYGSINVADAIIKNNLFLGDGSSDFAFNSVTTTTITNNIFYGRAPISDAVTGTLNNSTFTNNMSFSTGNDTFPIGSNGNTGSGNFEATDPQFVGVSVVDDWDFANDPSLSGGSAINGGNDGTDIGLTGGTIPFSITGTPLPTIRVLRLPEIIKQGDNVDATIEADGN